MVSYLQLERTAGGTIEVQEPVVFDAVLSSGGTQIAYNTATGELSFNEAGHYYIDWFVAPQFGLPTDGSNFAIVTSDGAVLTGSSHVRVSPTVGFAIIEVTLPNTVASLINTSDSGLTLSQAVNTKAALAVFAVAGPDTAAE